VYTDPEPETNETAGDTSPPFASWKSVESTPVTLSLNVTVHETDEALVGVAPERLIDTTNGGVVSILHE
jgi:hypothetical protein